MSNLPRAAVAVDVTEGFRAAMAEAGIVCEGPIHADGQIHRFHVQGDRAGTLNGWYVLHDDGVPAGAFGSWKGITGTWRASTRMSTSDANRNRERMKSAIRAAARERERVAKAATTKAVEIWEAAPPADQAHEYLLRKRVRAHGLRQKGKNLVVPVFDVRGGLISLQTIASSGSKRFLPGCHIKGGTYILGAVGKSIIMVEGYATGATLHELTGRPVAIAFNSGNLKPAALALRQRWPKIEIVFAADNDHVTPGNPGIQSAREAAHAIRGGRLIAPPPEEGITDWNDVFVDNGPGLILEVFG